MWVWNCRTGDLIFTHYGRIAYNNTVEVYFECVSTNVFFSNHGCYPVMREDIVSSVDVKTVKVTKYKITENEDVVVGAEVFRTITFQSIIDKRVSERNELKARREKEAEARIAAATKKAAKKTANAVAKAAAKTDAETDTKAAAKAAKKETSAAKAVVRAVKKEKKSE
jgi:regulator of protease activity HflC (stomatin/prohibitin superfamily)